MIRAAWRSSTDAVQQEMPDLTKLLGSIGLVAHSHQNQESSALTFSAFTASTPVASGYPEDSLNDRSRYGSSPGPGT